jgi:hypothetical protein
VRIEPLAMMFFQLADLFRQGFDRAETPPGGKPQSLSSHRDDAAIEYCGGRHHSGGAKTLLYGVELVYLAGKFTSGVRIEPLAMMFFQLADLFRQGFDRA